jgi:uncharacterized protein with HEPN domain
MRNFPAHRHFAIDWSIVWDTATQDVPALRQQVAAIIEIDDPATDSSEPH